MASLTQGTTDNPAVDIFTKVYAVSSAPVGHRISVITVVCQSLLQLSKR
jgi:hypothetical protein